MSFDLIGRENLFTVTQAEFDGYEGQWYLVDANDNNWAKAGAGAVFNVKAPKLDLSIRDPSRMMAQMYLASRFRRPRHSSSRSAPTCTPCSLTRPYGTRYTPEARNKAKVTLILLSRPSPALFSSLCIVEIPECGSTRQPLNVKTQPYTWGRANDQEEDLVLTSTGIPQPLHPLVRRLTRQVPILSVFSQN